MKTYMILSLVGKDRPGIVDAVSGFLLKCDANLEDSRMAAMGGCFTMMSLFLCGVDQLGRIRAGLDDLRAEGFEVSLHAAADPSGRAIRPALPLKLEITSMDHPGIVQDVVHLLHLHHVNIESLESTVTRAPLSGAPLFNLKLEVAVGAEANIGKIKSELEELAERMNMDLNFRS